MSARSTQSSGSLLDTNPISDSSRDMRRQALDGDLVLTILLPHRAIMNGLLCSMTAPDQHADV